MRHNLTDEDSFDERSDDKGAEPEGLVLAEIEDRLVGLCAKTSGSVLFSCFIVGCGVIIFRWLGFG